MRRDRKNRRHMLIAAPIAVAVLAWSANITLPPVSGNPAATVATGVTPTPCVIRTSDGEPIANNDPLARFLTASAACPANVFEFRSQLTAQNSGRRSLPIAGSTIRETIPNPSR